MPHQHPSRRGVGTGPDAVAVSPDGADVWVPNALDATVSEIANAPGPPRQVTATAGNAQATVAWSVPSSDGGSAITDYAVTATPGRARCVTATTSCTVTGLQSATAYTFAVSATNAVGRGSPSPYSSPVTPVSAASAHHQRRASASAAPSMWPAWSPACSAA